jgi:hypothetical protein
MVAASLYLLIEVGLLILAWVQFRAPSLGDELVPFMLLSLPWFLFFDVCFGRATGDGIPAIAGVVANAFTIYFVFATLSRLRSKASPGPPGSAERITKTAGLN